MHERCHVASGPPQAPVSPPSAAHGAPRVLVVDDQIGPADPLVRLLVCDGFAIDCAATAAEALAFTTAASYDAIILDLCLPDVPGLVVLARLRARGNDVPILVLTGFGDAQAAHAAGRLGAARFMTKPVFLDLGAALREIIAPAATDSPLMATRADHGGPDQRVETLAVAALMEGLDELTRAAPESRGHRGGELAESTPGRERQRLLAVLLRAVSDPALPVPCFAVCAKSLRRAVADRSAGSVRETAESVAALVLGVVAGSATDPRVSTAIARLRRAVTARQRLTEEEVGRDMGVHPSHVGRILKAETGLSFRSWRSGFFMQAIVRHLIETREQVAQIAYHQLGYEHPSQLDREFHETFGVSPREFRRLWQAVMNSQMPDTAVRPSGSG